MNIFFFESSFSKLLILKNLYSCCCIQYLLYKLQNDSKCKMILFFFLLFCILLKLNINCLFYCDPWRPFAVYKYIYKKNEISKIKPEILKWWVFFVFWKWEWRNEQCTSPKLHNNNNNSEYEIYFWDVTI
jgi:hypothetical protein